ncbi:MAG: RNA repair transcriptional activator RtcR [Lautropia sp.]|nr:RNA repair transcriptional activator RtcR [Lautropia sp.]
MNKRTVIIGYLGTQLDSGQRAGRWKKWRPTLSMVQQAHPIDRLELFYAPKYEALLNTVVADIAEMSPNTVVNPIPMPLDDPWDFGEVYANLYDWAKRQHFDTEHEDYWVHITTGTHVAQICLFLMVEARFIPGVLLQSSPPRKRLPSNINTAQDEADLHDEHDEAQADKISRHRRWSSVGTYTLIDLDLSRYDGLAQRFEHARQQAQEYLKNGIPTRNLRFNQLIDEIEQVAIRSQAPILLSGPTGAGKSHLARRIFELKKARHQIKGAFIEVNCATLRGDTASATLFGHKKGAFTGAATERAGLLRSAHQGILFLDEIGELGLDEQAMLLKAVEEKRFYPLGSDQEAYSDFQLMAGTNRDLRTEVLAGRFREDLFARINLWTYHLPGLAERPEDIEPNIDHLLARMPTEGGKAAHFNREAKTRYLDFAQSDEALWRGNFRDLSASITRLATLAEGGRITTTLVEAEISRLRWLWQQPGDESAKWPVSMPASSRSEEINNRPASSVLASLLSEETLANLDLFDRLQLETVLHVCQQSNTLAEAGRRLFSQSRTQRRAVNDSDRLRKYLMKFGLSWQQVRGI